MITQTNFYKENKEEIVGGLAVGLVMGLAGGLIWGLIWGLVMGLAGGLVMGLVMGLIWGLVMGLAGGLIWGLARGLIWGLIWGLVMGLAGGLAVILTNWSEAFPFITQFKEIVFLIFVIVLLIEVFYWFDSEKPKGKVTMFVLKKKFEVICEVLLGLSGIAQIYILVREINFPKLFSEILKWAGYMGVGLLSLGVIIGLIYLWLQLNKQKYRR